MQKAISISDCQIYSSSQGPVWLLKITAFPSIMSHLGCSWITLGKNSVKSMELHLWGLLKIISWNSTRPKETPYWMVSCLSSKSSKETQGNFQISLIRPSPSGKTFPDSPTTPTKAKSDYKFTKGYFKKTK